MADQKISALTVASSDADADLIAVVQGGTTKRAALSVLANYILGKVGGLTAASSLADADVLAGLQSTNLRKFSLSDIATYVAGKLFVYTDINDSTFNVSGQNGIRMVADSATYANTWTPGGGRTNPVLGTGGYVRGRVRKLGKDVTVRFTVQCSPNSVGQVRTDMSSDVVANRLTRTAAHGYTNGMAVIPSGLGTTVLPASTNPDGSYYVINVGGGGGNDLQLALTSGGTAIDMTGSNATNITLTAVAFDKGTGIFYRMALPYFVTSAAQFDQAVIGDGHLFLNQTVFGLGPRDFTDVHFHVAKSVDSSVCGIVVGTNASASNLTAAADGTNSNYSETHHSDLRTIDETAPTGTYAEGDAEAARHYAATVRQDATAAFKGMTGDNVGPTIPLNWGPNMRLIGKMNYETV